MLLPPDLPGHDQAGVLEHLQVLHHAEPGHVEAALQFAQALPVPLEQAVEDLPPGRVTEGPEHRVVHGAR